MLSLVPKFDPFTQFSYQPLFKKCKKRDYGDENVHTFVVASRQLARCLPFGVGSSLYKVRFDKSGSHFFLYVVLTRGPL